MMINFESKFIDDYDKNYWVLYIKKECKYI